MRSYKRPQSISYAIRFASTNEPGLYSRWEGQASCLEDAFARCKDVVRDNDSIAFIQSISVNGVRLSKAGIEDINRRYFSNLDECDGGVAGGAAGGDAGGAAAGGDAGDVAGEMAGGISTSDVLGKYEPGKGFMGDNFYIPSRVAVPLHRWEIANGGSRRKKGKNGKPKKTPYEKDMKVVVKMFEKETTNEVEEMKITADVKSKANDAKSDAYKMKSAEDVKKFMDANKSKIADVSKKLKGDAKKNFDKIVDVVNNYCKTVDEAKDDTKLKLICGLVAVIMWLIGMGGAWIIAAASPIIGPLLIDVLKKAPGLSESDVAEDETVHDDQVSDETKLMLEVPGTSGAEIEVEGDWKAVRFAVDMFTDALNHMREKDSTKYAAVKLHVV